MKRKTIVMQGRRVVVTACSLLMGAALLQSCKDDDDVLSGQPSWLGNSIYEQLQQYGNYKTLLHLIDDVEDNREVLSHTGSRTLFATNDSAYAAWFQTTTWRTGTGDFVRKYEDLSDVQKKVLLNSSMLNNAYLVELMSNVEGTPPSEGRAMRRLSMADIYDSVTVMTVDQMPQTDYWEALRNKNKSIRIFKDNSRAPIIHFLPAYMKRNGFTTQDLSLLTNRPATSLEDAWVNGVKIVERDITCKNGYIHKVDGVIESSPNMAEIVHQHPEMSHWASLLDRFSAPYVRYVISTRDGNETQLAKFQRLYQTEDSVYALRYLSKQSDVTTASMLNNKLDNGDIVKKEELLKFDPGWNQYIYTNTANEDLHYDAGAMIVPTNEAFETWWNGDGRDLQNEYGHWSNIPQNTLASLLNVNLLDNFNQMIPSKFDMVLNDAKEQLGIKPENVVSSYMGCNGVVYMVDKVFTPAEFSSVMYPATAHPSVMGLIYTAINSFDFKPYLISMDQTYSVFLPSDKALHYYMDPAYFGTKTPVIIEFNYDNDSKKISASRYNVTIDENGNLIKGLRRQLVVSDEVIEDRLRDLLDELIIVGDVTDGHEFYKTKGGSIVRVNNAGAGVNGMTIQGAWQIAHGAEIPVVNFSEGTGKELEAVVKKRNGTTYLLDSIAPLSAEPSVYQTLQKHAKDEETNTDAQDDAYKLFYNLLNNDGCGLLIDKDGKTDPRTVLPNGNKNISLFSNYNYTVYVPTNASIQQLIDDGLLPTWDDYEAQTADVWHGDEEKAAKAKELIQKIIVNFLRYHIQDNSLMLGAKPATGIFESMMRDEETGRFLRLNVKQSGKTAKEATLDVTDLQGNTRHVVKSDGHFNNICREYWFKGKGEDAIIYFVSGAIVHQIDGPLLYQEMKPWRQLLNEL